MIIRYDTIAIVRLRRLQQSTCSPSCQPSSSFRHNWRVPNAVDSAGAWTVFLSVGVLLLSAFRFRLLRLPGFPKSTATWLGWLSLDVCHSGLSTYLPRGSVEQQTAGC